MESLSSYSFNNYLPKIFIYWFSVVDESYHDVQLYALTSPFQSDQEIPLYVFNHSRFSSLLLYSIHNMTSFSIYIGPPVSVGS